MTRKTVAILVLIGGVLASFLIARSGSPSGDGNERLSLSSAGGNDPSFAFSESDASSSGSSDQNLTEQVVQRYGEEALKLNPPGTSQQSIALPSEATLDNIIADALQAPFSFTTVSVRDIRTSTHADKSSVIAYLDAISAAEHERFGSLSDSLVTAVARFVADGTREPLAKERDATAAYIDDLLTIPVPVPLSIFQVELVNLWNKRLAIANAILTNEDDPFKATVAMDALSNLASEDERVAALLSTTVRGMNL